MANYLDRLKGAFNRGYLAAQPDEEVMKPLDRTHPWVASGVRYVNQLAGTVAGLGSAGQEGIVLAGGALGGATGERIGRDLAAMTEVLPAAGKMPRMSPGAVGRVVSQGGNLLADTRASVPSASELLSRLTPRQRQVAELIQAGKSRKEMATTLNMAEGTLKIHIGDVLNALDAPDRRTVKAMLDDPSKYQPAAEPSGPLIDRLTPRQAEVAKLVQQGQSYKQIASQLDISLPTAKNHISSILQETGAQSRYKLQDALNKTEQPVPATPEVDPHAASRANILAALDRIDPPVAAEPAAPAAPASTTPIMDSMSPAQRRVAQGIAEGKSTKEIARDLGVSEGTVKIHTGAVLSRTGASDRVAAQAALLQESPPDKVGPAPQFTTARGRVADLISQGYGTAEIADKLGIAQGTVRTHQDLIVKQLGVDPSKGKAGIISALAKTDHQPGSLMPAVEEPNLIEPKAPGPTIMSNLTPRQQEVAAALSEGKSNKAIARDLNISDGVVKTHILAILDRAGTSDRHEAQRMLISEAGQPSAGASPITDPFRAKMANMLLDGHSIADISDATGKSNNTILAHAGRIGQDLGIGPNAGRGEIVAALSRYDRAIEPTAPVETVAPVADTASSNLLSNVGPRLSKTERLLVDPTELRPAGYGVYVNPSTSQLERLLGGRNGNAVRMVSNGHDVAVSDNAVHLQIQAALQDAAHPMVEGETSDWRLRPTSSGSFVTPSGRPVSVVRHANDPAVPFDTITNHEDLPAGLQGLLKPAY